MKISIITLFPQMFEKVFSTKIIDRAKKAGIIDIEIIDLRTFGTGKHKTVDDRPYGGGAGMILKVDVLDEAIKRTKMGLEKEIVVLLDPKGKIFTQNVAEDLSAISHLILVCGHYEGFDERVRILVDLEISLGDFVLSGGEIPAMAVADAVIRLLPGVLTKMDATISESFSCKSGTRILEYPHYTRPSEYKGKKVPKELLSGNPKIVESFRTKKAYNITKKRRPDILNNK